MTGRLNLKAVNSALKTEVRKLQDELKAADRRVAILHMALVVADAEMRAGNMETGRKIVRAALEEDVND